MADVKLTDKSELTSLASGDFLHTVDVSDTTSDAAGTSKKITADNVHALGDSRTATLTNKTIDANNNTISNLEHGAEVDNPSTGVHGVTGNVVGTSDTQTLTNKTIDADNNTVSNLAHGAEVDDPSSGVHGVTGSVVGTSDTQTLTNKTLTTPTLTLKQGAAAAPTAEGDMQWDTDDDQIKVGDGVGTKVFSSDTDLTITESQISDLDHTDADAIHDNVAGEITAITEKVSPASADVLVIEDSADSNNKKRIQVGNLPGGGGGGAPTTAQYVTLATDATLTNERVLTAGEGIDLTDGGAGSTITVSGEDASTTNKGIIEIATAGEVTTGTDNTRAVSPSGLTNGYQGSANIDTVGTITTGTWEGTTVAVDQGGTGQTSYTNGQLLIGNTTGNTLAKATITEGAGINVTNGAGSITIAGEDSSTTNKGIVELATTAETETGTDTTRAVTPDGLNDMTTLANKAWFLDQDDMSGDDATKAASQQSIKAYVDDSLGLLNSTIDGRLTLTTGTPVTTSDVSAAATLYYTPYTGNQIALYDGSAGWDIIEFSEISVSLTGTTADRNYDIFIYNSSGTATLETLIWTNDTTRATALVYQDGVLVKSGATTRRYVGTIRINSTGGQTEDKKQQRYVWNYYNRVPWCDLSEDDTNTWTVNSATYAAMNSSNADWKHEFVIGVDEYCMKGTISVLVTMVQSPSVTIGLDGTTQDATKCTIAFGADPSAGTDQVVLNPDFSAHVGIGYHYFQGIERNSGAGGTAFFGDGSVPVQLSSSMISEGWR